jgi:hypothetical protein
MHRNCGGCSEKTGRVISGVLGCLKERKWLLASIQFPAGNHVSNHVCSLRPAACFGPLQQAQKLARRPESRIAKSMT